MARLKRHPEEIDIAAAMHGREQLARAWREHYQAASAATGRALVNRG
ncbi:hypothetical protein [Streptomyces xiamenensis]